MKRLLLISFLFLITLFFLVKLTRAQIADFFRKTTISSEIIGPVKHWISPEDLKKQYASTYKKVIPAHEFHTGYWPFEANPTKNSYSIPEAFVVTINEGRVYGKDGVVITPNDEIIKGIAIDWTNAPHGHPLFNKWRLGFLEKQDCKVAVVSNLGAHGYYHWMFDILPRLEILRLSGVAYDKIYINADKAFQKNSIESLGIPEKKILQASRNRHIKARELIIPSLPGGTGNPPDWACQFLRQTFLKSPPQKQNLRLFISRKKAGRRHILNEDDLFLSLREKGFQKVFLEEMTIEKQAQLFASADWIVAPHGAGLTNLVFCSPHAHVIEIFSPHHVNRCYWSLGKHLDLDYHIVITQAHPHTSNSDIVVDIEKVIQILKNPS